MRLTEEEIDSVNWNDFSRDDIEALIDLNVITNDDMVWYYGNLQWND